ncbi:tRNA (adenosine(37)-N6)-dimethylallyltransferase MiaA [Lentiprolixibacter aurantiacus]|uniref:tRNA dimethylallyltransferase n=1 Tax=Lentiprolixibacter aurantiacus TaxID=2993939 RepID=A0AAE3MKG5_9FLAO|nr:tRNA (adenosine(37)-N6)-dimethylallyltransferase MiaA [Lentiprolixibacter aurantiacus]MCX2719390.1 tRNA (adenosine(37)-N6)-dimethylallyltransferase MiaA [Lentiprolixibacter aurantiacus]
MNKFLITVIGPTAIGKTALAVSLANHFDTVIISSDSRQFYKEMSIGTAVPTTAEKKGIPHHFLQHVSITTPYSVGDFEAEALQMIHNLFQTHDTLILVGGSGLYTDAVLKGLDTFPEVSPGVREELNQTLEQKGISALQQELKALDPEYFQRVDIQNPHRLIRALEVCKSSGKPYSSFLGKPKANRLFKPVVVGLKAEREILYERIHARVDQMMADGLLEEVKKLLPYKDYNALQTVGYQELFAFLEGVCSKETAVETIKKNTRRFAKRQLTWYRKTTGVHWFDYQTPHHEIATVLEEKIDLMK